MRTIRYTPDLDIRNSDQLPAGAGCSFLVCIDGMDGALVAKQWLRKRPTTLQSHETLVELYR